MKRAPRRQLGVLLGIVAACGAPGKYASLPAESGNLAGDTHAPDGEATPPVRPPLAQPARFLRRVALDLTGHLPSPVALRRVADDPSLLDAEVDALIADPQLTERMVHMLDERWHLRVEAMPVGPEDYGWDAHLRYQLAREMAEEPLRLMAEVIRTDASWNTVVESETTMATPLLASVWPLALADPGAEDWQPATWTDHRPTVGVLASNGLWWRYNTTFFNYNRTRAAALSRLLLCYDYLELLVEFESPSLGDTDGTETAIRENPGCTVCHDTLDPIAAAMFGFWAYDLYDPLELSRYHPEREPLGSVYLGVDPAWYGAPIAGLSDVGAAVVADPRFPSCAVETFAGGLWRRPTGDEDTAELAMLTAWFEHEGRRVPALLTALTATEAYVGTLAEAPMEGATDRLLGPQQLAAVLVETVDFVWVHDGENQLDSDVTGLRVPLGGVDGEEVTGPKRAPDANLVLAQRAVAEAAARHALDALSTGECPLLPGATLATGPGDPEFADAVAHAVWWLTATEADPTTVEGLEGVWQAAGAADPAEGWAAVLAALFQDPLFVTY